ncbi:cyclin-dependent kinase-like 3 isoform X2 [Betta splendens]|uniref:Cyclin-dependent kinase-like 2 n=1 Tax=Betta splendens TaxID=158456 RepID=A0A6P7PA98_BETSP|nr:cyclin-dependent kinase-like 3 isoform X2 [Betta splendens]
MERYESLGLVGEGSYGTVLKCRHRDTGRLVAIKKFTDSDSDKTVKKIATREIKLLRKLSHDNLVNLLEVWKRRRRWYLVFEFVDRTLLDDLEQHPKGLDPNTSRQYLYQILRAAAFCHERKIVHRDIKPENVLVSRAGVVKLCDFGLARTLPSAAGGVYTDYVATRWYRAPELLVGDAQYGRPVDVWAVGCLFLEMLTGQPLFPGDSDLDQIYHIIGCFGSLTAHHQHVFLRNPVFSGVRLPQCCVGAPLQDRCPAITPSALDLAQRCLQMDPEGRAQCSQLLEHPLFTLDCFHIRFMEELNAKIQKEHRENATLPKIMKTPRQDKNDGNDKKPRGKNRKPPGAVDEKVLRGTEQNDEKQEKMRGKQPSSLPRTVGNKSGSLVSRQSRFYNTTRASMSTKGKASGSESRHQPDVCTIAEGFSSDLPEAPANGSDLKDVSSEAEQDCLKVPENREAARCISLHSGCRSTAETNVMDVSRTFKSETSQGFWRSRSTSHTHVATRPEAARPEAARPEAARPEAVRPETTRPETTRPETTRPEATRPEATRPEATFPETTRPEATASGRPGGGPTLHAPPLTGDGAAGTQEDLWQPTARPLLAQSPLSSLAPRPALTPGLRAWTGGFVLHNMDTMILNEFTHESDPPPAPSSPPLLLPPPPTPLIPSFSFIGASSPPLSDHLPLETGFHPVGLSLRYGERPRRHGGISSRPGRPSLTTPITASQVSDKSLMVEQSDDCNFVHSGGPAEPTKVDACFPDVPIVGLSELRGRDGKKKGHR